MQPHPVTLDEVLNTLEPWRIAKFLHTEVPIRFAERIRWMEELPGWEAIPELRQVHAEHVRAFRDLLNVERHPTLDRFNRVVKDVVKTHSDVVARVAHGMAKLRVERGDVDCGADVVDAFLDKFLLNRIGTSVLMSQYLARVNLLHASFGPTGIVDPHCDVASVCREKAQEVQNLYATKSSFIPIVRVEAYSAVGDDAGIPRFSYIPPFLHYIIAELLKNSSRATVEVVKSEDELQERPISIVVCADEHRVAIRVSDKARGIPFEVGSQVWSYLYSTLRRRNGESPNELAGYGVGLPLSRLYARYLGGSLDLVSLPGYGTDAFLMLPRLVTDLLEVVPDRDTEVKYHTLSDYMF